MTLRKVTTKLIQRKTLRKGCFKKRRVRLINMVQKLTTLCDIDACVIIRGLEDTGPMVWPSPTVAKNLLQRFQNAPVVDRNSKMDEYLVYKREKIKRLERHVAKLREKNDQKEMSIFMHRIYLERKSLSDFEVSELRRLLSYVEEKLKDVRKRISHFEQSLPPNPPPSISCSLDNKFQDDIDSSISIDEQVPEQQSVVDLVKEADKKNNGTNYNTVSNMGLNPVHTYSGDSDMVLAQINCRGFSVESDSGVLPPGSVGYLISESDSRVLPSCNFGGLNGKNDSGISPKGHFRGINIENDSRLFPQGNFSGLNVESDQCHQSNFGANNGEASMGKFDANLVGSNNGRNFNTGSPTHGNFASSG